MNFSWEKAGVRKQEIGFHEHRLRKDNAVHGVSGTRDDVCRVMGFRVIVV